MRFLTKPYNPTQVLFTGRVLTTFPICLIIGDVQIEHVVAIRLVSSTKTYFNLTDYYMFDLPNQLQLNSPIRVQINYLNFHAGFGLLVDI